MRVIWVQKGDTTQTGIEAPSDGLLVDGVFVPKAAIELALWDKTVYCNMEDDKYVITTEEDSMKLQL